MKVIFIKESYKIWNINCIIAILNGRNAREELNRSYLSLITEWYLHNILYYITLPFIKIKYFKKLNERAKHVDLEEKIKRK